MNRSNIRRAASIAFTQVEPPQRTASERAAIANHWAAATAANPSLFDGPVIDVRSTVWHGTSCSVHWALSTYSAYLWRYGVPAGSGHCYTRALFVSVVVTTEAGQLVLGQMGTATSTAGRLQLPGGNVELAVPWAGLTVESVRRDAARELAEETGLILETGVLRLWAIKEDGEFGDVGVFFRADGIPTATVYEQFAHRSATVSAAGLAPEFALLHLRDLGTAGPGPVPDSPHTAVDYLPDLLVALHRDPAARKDTDVRG